MAQVTSKPGYEYKTSESRRASIYRWKNSPAGKAYAKRYYKIWKAKQPKKPKRPKLTAKQIRERAKACNKRYVKGGDRYHLRVAYRKVYEQKPRVKLLHSMRVRLGRIVRGCSLSKNSYELIGCSPDFLVTWLESKFEPGMSWDNYGQWHMDHIIPCAAFNIEDREEAKKCFHYSNLRPLWAKQNIAKNAKIEPHTQPELPIHINL